MQGESCWFESSQLHIMTTNNDRLHRELVDLLYQHDPVGLAKMGAPSDEYTHEAEMICEALQSQTFTTIAQLRQSVYTIFKEMFDQVAGTEDVYQKVAEDIFRLTHHGH